MSRDEVPVQRQPGPVEASSDLIRDYHQTLIPPLRSDLLGVFEVVQSVGAEKGRTELVSVGPDEELRHFYPDPSSHSGWSVESVAVPDAPSNTSIDKLVAFYQDDLLYVFVLYAAASGAKQVVGLFSDRPGSWGPLPLGPQLTEVMKQMQQTDAYRDAEGRYFIYGIATAAFNVPTFVLASEDPSTKQWVVNYLEAVSESSGSNASYRVLDGYSGNQMTLVRFERTDATFQGGSISGGVFRPGGGTVTFDLGQGPLTSQEALSLASPTHEQGFLLLTAGQELFLVTGYDTGKPEVTSLGGQPNAPDRFLGVAMGVDLEGRYVVFAIGADNSLWLARQAAASSGSAVAFQPWVALGNAVNTLGCPAAMSDGPEVFLVGLNADLTHLAQALMDRIWKTTTLATPSPSTQAPVEMTVFSREFVVRDREGNLLQNVPVHVTADRKAVVTVNGLTHHVDTVNSAVTVSNLQGRVIVSSQAVSLSSLGLTLTVGGEGGSPQGPFRADLRTHQRLAGQDDTLTVSGQALQQAGIVPASVSPSQADAYAAQLMSLGSLAVKQHRQGVLRHGSSSVGPATGFSIDFSGGSPVCRLLSEEAARFAWESAEDGESIWGDVAHFFEQELDKLVSLTIQVLDDAAQVVINGVKYLLTTLADVVKAIELFLVKLAEEVVDAIEKVIEWLKMLFDWEDILDTQEVVTYYLTQALGNLKNQVSLGVPQEVVRGFGAVRNEIEQEFDKVVKYFTQNDQSLHQLVPSQWSNPIGGDGPPLQGNGVRTAISSNAVRCNYVRNKLSTYLSISGDTAALAVPTFDLKQIFEVFEQQFPAENLKQAIDKIWDFQKQVSDPKSFPDSAVIDVLQAIEDIVLLVLAGIETLLLAMLDLAADALQTLSGALTAPLDVPVLSWLYQELTGETLTLSGALTLLIAVPATILYKILFGGSELTPPFSKQDVETIKSQPIPWPQVGGSQRRTGFEPTANGSTDLDAALAVVFCIGFVVYAFEDSWLDCVTALSYDTPDILDDLKAPIAFFSWAAIASSIVTQALGVPYQAMENPESATDDWVIAAWAVAWSPVLADLLATCAEGRLMRMVSSFGPACGFAVGGVGIAVAIPAAAMMSSPRYNAWNRAELVLPTLPYLFQPIVIAGWDGVPNAIAQSFLAFVDLFSDVGTGVCKVAGLSSGAVSDGGAS